MSNQNLKDMDSKKVNVIYKTITFGELLQQYKNGGIIFADYSRCIERSERLGFKLDAEYFIQSCLLNVPCRDVLIFHKASEDGSIWYNTGDGVLLHILSFCGCLPESNANGWCFYETMRLPQLKGYSFKDLPENLIDSLMGFIFQIAIIN